VDVEVDVDAEVEVQAEERDLLFAIVGRLVVSLLSNHDHQHLYLATSLSLESSQVDDFFARLPSRDKRCLKDESFGLSSSSEVLPFHSSASRSLSQIELSFQFPQETRQTPLYLIIHNLLHFHAW